MVLSIVIILIAIIINVASVNISNVTNDVSSFTKESSNKSSNHHNIETKSLNISRRTKRQDFGFHDLPFEPLEEFPPDFNGLGAAAGIGGAGLAGTAALALAAVKAGAKGLGTVTLLTLPIGLAVLGGLAALAAGVLPPASIGGITLPVVGGRRKRQAIQAGVKDPVMLMKMQQLDNLERFFASLPKDDLEEDRMLAMMITCSGLQAGHNRCLERLSCEASKPHLKIGNTEREFIDTILELLLTNHHIAADIKNGIRAAKDRGRLTSLCGEYVCDKF